MIELIPAIDIIDGKCVRLSQGDYDTKKIYNEKPLEVAKEFEANGIQRLHVVDLDGAKSSHVVNYKVLDAIAGHTSLTIDFGGGIKTDEDLMIAFENGAHMVTLGSVAVILGADVKDNRISVSGWLEEGPQELMPFLTNYTQEGVSKVLCTDISRDGMLQGPSIELYKQVMQRFPTMHLIASGGVSGVDDIIRLDDAGIPAVVFGKALYEGRITMKDLKRLM